MTLQENNLYSFFKFWLIFVAVTVASAFQGAEAGESGYSHYVPGTYNDFFMNMKLDPGFYFRADFMYYDAKFPNSVSLGGNVATNVNLDVWTNILKLAYVSDLNILGGSYGTALFLPIVFDAKVSANVEVGPFLGGGTSSHSAQDNRGGIGDMVAVPLLLTWKWGDFDVNLGHAIYMPSGYYKKGEIINLGRNYWSFDTFAGLTWLHPSRGHEVSFKAGIMINTKNDATQYQTGDEFHMDFTIAQHFSKQFGVGVTGYYYNQFSHDKGPLLDRMQEVINQQNQLRQQLGQQALPAVGGFRGEATGIGPIIRYSPKIGTKQVHFIGKWIHEFDVQNRFKGEYGMLSAAFDF